MGSSLRHYEHAHRVRLGPTRSHRALEGFSSPLPKRVQCSPQRFREENAVVRFISRS